MKDYYDGKIKNKQKKTILKSIIVKLIYILLVPIIIWDIIILFQTMKNPYETPNVFGIKTFCIISGSMEPEISVNDVVIIKETPKEEIKKGDIISFDKNGDIITHRIIYLTTNKNGETTYITKGDANNIEDEGYVEYKDIEGKMIGKIPKIGKIIMALKSETTLIITLVILITIYIVEQRIERKKDIRKNKRENYEKEKNRN